MKKIYFLFLSLLLVQQSIHAQWTFVGSALTSTARGLYFQDADTGYAVGYNGSVGQVAKTLDGGATWASTSVPGSYLLRAVTFLNKDTGYACGVMGSGVFPTTTGVFVKTEDAGATWNIMFTDSPQYLRAIDFISSDTGFMGGAAGTILKTTDGGTTWTTINLGETTSDIIQLNMVNANIGYAVASGGTSPFLDGYVFKTADGGNSWLQVHYDSAFGYLGLGVADVNTVYVGGGTQAIIKTTDGGLTWDTVHIGTSGAIRCGFALSSSIAFMGDDAGHVLSTKNGGASWNDTLLPVGLFSMYFSGLVGYIGNLSGGIYKDTFQCALPVAASAVIGLDTACSGSSEQYSITPVDYADAYSWSVPADAVINSGQGTTQINVTYGVLSGQVSVTSVSGLCGGAGGSISKDVVVNPSPSPTITFSNNTLSSSDLAGNQWYFNGSPIGGATDSTYIPTQNGTYYTVVTSSNGCSGTSNSINVIGLGINTVSGFSIAIFPNPSMDDCTIYFPKMSSGKLRIVNAAGAIELSENNLTGEMYRLNTAALPSGFHLVRLYDRENHLIATSKLIVQ